ncbi:hypothetical protein, partial [Vibrio salilacus]|uniref:hypothetical protein n=1 Tax=Vibrio salilacus TaxID=1323749 RepID=UPI001C12CEB2
ALRICLKRFVSCHSKPLILFVSTFANAVFQHFEKLNSGAASKRLPLKPLGTYNAAENWPKAPKRPFGKTMSQS